MEWSGQQKDAIEKVQDWIADRGDKQIFRLFGFAGSGKTSVTNELVKNVDGDVLYCAYTGKAALVMRSKGSHNARTIHSLIYKPREDPVTGKLTFELDQNSPVQDAGLIVCDECSMVSSELAQDLMSFGTKILVMGDPGQLPPISGTGYFMSELPDIMLTEIHRQALDNPIIQLATTARQGGKLKYGTYGESRVIPRSALTQADVLNSDQVLVGMNKTRQNINRRIRSMLGFDSEFPDIGDKLICLKNNKDKGLLNGGMWTCMSREMNERTISMMIKSLDLPDMPPISVDVPYAFFTGTEAELEKWFRRSHDEFTYARAITVHKSQGSQFEKVTLFDESGVFRDDSAKWLYTGLTRAAKSITVVMG